MFLEGLDNETRSALLEPLSNRAIELTASPLDSAATTIPTIDPSASRQQIPSNQMGDHLNNTFSNSFHNQRGIQELPCFNDLIAVLIECFALITLGYMSGRFKLISPEAKDLGAYLSTFALPMVIFLNVAQMEIRTINLSLLACMLVSKLIVFALVSLVTLAISYPSNFSYAGALAILSTQSNDFALGYPLFKSLYGKSHPEMLNYLNLMGPIQLLVINPLGIVMLELGKLHQRRRAKRNQMTALSMDQTRERCSHCLAVNESHKAVTRPELSFRQDHASNSNEHSTMKRKNHKSLMLVMPAVNLDDSEQQVATGSGLNRSPVSSQSPFEHQMVQQPRNSSPLSWLSSANLIHPTSPPQPTLTSRCTCPSQVGADQTVGEPMIDLGFIKALLTNPLIIMSLLALAVNLIHGPELPKFVTKVSSTIAASFAAPALLVVGLSMHGKFKLILSNPNDLLLASALVITKGLVLPNIMRSAMQVVLPHYVDPKDIPSLVDFSYLYGLLPTAPGACIIAKQYEVLTNVVSLSMLLSTIFSAPLMLGTSGVISRASSITPEIVLQTTSKVLTVTSSVTLVLSLITMYLIWKSSGHATQFITGAMRGASMFKSRLLFTILLTLTQLLVGIGGFMWLFVDLSKIKLDSKQPTTPLDDDGVRGAPSLHWHQASPDYEVVDEVAEQDKQSLFRGPARPHGFLSASGGPSITSLACTLGFIHASGGLMLTRFLIGCIVVINFARASCGYQKANQMSTLIMRSFPLVVTSIVMCLVFDSSHLTCKPTEPSLPLWPFSLHTRLIFNAVIFLVTVSMFVMTFRLKNQTLSFASLRPGIQHNHSPLTTSAGTLSKNNFVASSASLTSGTSSEITTSTSIDTNVHGPSQSARKGANTRQTCGIESDNDANLLLDCNRLLNHKLVSVPSTGIFGPQDNFVCEMRMHGYDEMTSEADQIHDGHVCDLNNNGNQLEDFINVRGPTLLKSHSNSFMVNDRALVPGQAEAERAPISQDLEIPIESSGFDRNSILIVFIMLQTLLSFTSIVQIIFQDRSTGGTFIVVELTNLVVDFGQGLVTFLVVGLQALPKSNFRLQSIDHTRV